MEIFCSLIIDSKNVIFSQGIISNLTLKGEKAKIEKKHGGSFEIKIYLEDGSSSFESHCPFNVASMKE